MSCDLHCFSQSVPQGLSPHCPQEAWNPPFMAAIFSLSHIFQYFLPTFLTAPSATCTQSLSLFQVNWDWEQSMHFEAVDLASLQRPLDPFEQSVS